jgi:hypothetical protein
MGSSLTTVIFYTGKGTGRKKFLCRESDGRMKHTFANLEAMKRGMKKLGLRRRRSKPVRLRNGTLLVRVSSSRSKAPNGYRFCGTPNTLAKAAFATAGVMAAVAGGVFAHDRLKTRRRPDSEIQRLRSALDRSKRELAGVQKKLSELGTENDQTLKRQTKTPQVSSTEKKDRSKQAQIRTLGAQLESTKEELANARDQLSGLRKKLKKQNTDTGNTGLREVQDSASAKGTLQKPSDDERNNRVLPVIPASPSVAVPQSKVPTAPPPPVTGGVPPPPPVGVPLAPGVPPPPASGLWPGNLPPPPSFGPPPYTHRKGYVKQQKVQSGLEWDKSSMYTKLEEKVPTPSRDLKLLRIKTGKKSRKTKKTNKASPRRKKDGTLTPCVENSKHQFLLIELKKRNLEEDLESIRDRTIDASVAKALKGWVAQYKTKNKGKKKQIQNEQEEGKGGACSSEKRGQECIFLCDIISQDLEQNLDNVIDREEFMHHVNAASDGFKGMLRVSKKVKDCAFLSDLANVFRDVQNQLWKATKEGLGRQFTTIDFSVFGNLNTQHAQLLVQEDFKQEDVQKLKRVSEKALRLIPNELFQHAAQARKLAQRLHGDPGAQLTELETLEKDAKACQEQLCNYLSAAKCEWGKLFETLQKFTSKLLKIRSEGQ